MLIYNTCSIREKAEVKVYSALGKQAKRKKDHMADLKIIVSHPLLCWVFFLDCV